MSAPVVFHSTNRKAPPVGLREALLRGQAPDRGLYLPDVYEPLAPSDFAALRSRSYPEIAYEVLRRFTRGVLADERLLALCRDAYDFDVPLERVGGEERGTGVGETRGTGVPAGPRRYVMRLDRGPTASFKDFAARMMARWMGALMADDGRELVILTATSGDTGSAVAHAYHGVERVRVVVLFPIDEVSDRQRRQMTTLGGNITTLAIDGKFDDCQAMVKTAFADPELSGIQLSSANSINIGRLLPQAVYYVYAYVRLADVGRLEPILFSVPSGNFGDMMGAVIARKLGVPIDPIVIATNANDEVPRFLRTGSYAKIEPSRTCLSNAMNVGHPSNLARLVEIYGGWMDEKGELKEPADLDRMRRELYAVSIDDGETRDTIQRAWKHHQLLLEPHGAVGWAGLMHFLAEARPSPEPLCVSVETAHPAKFPDEIRTLLGVEPPLPPALEGLDRKAEHFERMGTDYAAFRSFLAARFSP